MTPYSELTQQQKANFWLALGITNRPCPCQPRMGMPLLRQLYSGRT